MIWFLTRKPNMDGEGGMGMELLDAIKLTIPQVNALTRRTWGASALSSDEAKKQADELYRKDPEAYRAKVKAMIEAAKRSLPSG